MNWNQQLETIRWRALEEAGVDQDGWRANIRQEATARARQDLRAATAEVTSSADLEAFLERRSAALTDSSGGNRGEHNAEKESMKVPQFGGVWAWIGWVLALVFGFGLTGIGTDREINLLSLPLVGLLLWNAVVMLGSLVFEFLPMRGSGSGWISRWIVGRPDIEKGAVISPALKIFREFSLPLAGARIEAKARAWLHVAAAILALGSGLGMYAKGWSREYRAVWESTLLDENQAARFLGGLLGPASRLLGSAVPLSEIPQMRRGRVFETEGSPALPWIHLYAGTLLLGVCLPRLALAGIALLTEKSKRARIWEGQGWREYVLKSLREIEGGTEMIEVLVHAIQSSEEMENRWRSALRAKWGGLSGVRFTWVESGEEDDFTQNWVPPSSRVMLLFPLAATPEEEVQTRLSTELRERLRRRFPEGRLIVLLDGSPVKGRWDGDKISSRVQLWHRMLSAASDEIEILGLDESVNLLRVDVSEAR